jgi:hypothetical protein
VHPDNDHPEQPLSAMLELLIVVGRALSLAFPGPQELVLENLALGGGPRAGRHRRAVASQPETTVQVSRYEDQSPPVEAFTRRMARSARRATLASKSCSSS